MHTKKLHIALILIVVLLACSGQEKSENGDTELSATEAPAVEITSENITLAQQDESAQTQEETPVSHSDPPDEPGTTTSFDQAVDDVFKEFDNEVDETHAFFKQQVEAVWNEFRETTKKTWVDYSEDVSALNEIDFEEGVVKLETVIPVSEDDPVKVEENIVERLKNSLSDDNKTGINPLEGQLKFSRTGVVVGKGNAEEYVREEIKNNLKKERLESNDGVTRYQYSIAIHMIPDHLKVRAQKYLTETMDFSEKYDVEPALILAIIHTESWFNPFATSKVGACGLMQIMPKYGGRDAFGYVHGEARNPTRAYLYIPRNNIELGAAYVYLLRNKQLNYKKKDEKGKILALCAYNWGPGSVNKKIIQRHRIEDMEVGELIRVIKQTAPKETSDYHVKVTEREKIYERMFN
jgi:membrane-bound lytic murein transglycosylase C